jgi:hypothetical protein
MDYADITTEQYRRNVRELQNRDLVEDILAFAMIGMTDFAEIAQEEAIRRLERKR